MEPNSTEEQSIGADDLEREKLLLEIAELKKTWWKKPAYISALFPTLLTLVALVYGFANGYFQASFVKIENQKHDLQKEIDEFTHTRVDLQREHDRLVERNAKLAVQLDNVLASIDLNDETRFAIPCYERLKNIDEALRDYKQSTEDGH